MKIKLNNLDFELSFGFKCFMILGESLGLETFNQVVEKFSGFKDGTDISIEQLNLIENLVISAIEAHPKYYTLGYSHLDAEVINEVMNQKGLLDEIIKAFVASFPKAEGKPQPRKAAGKKRT